MLNTAFLIVGLILFLVAGVGVFWKKAAALASIPAFLLAFSGNLDRIESLRRRFQRLPSRPKRESLIRPSMTQRKQFVKFEDSRL